MFGDFENASFTYSGVQSQFSKKYGKFLVRTDVPDRKLTEYEIKYTLWD